MKLGRIIRAARSAACLCLTASLIVACTIETTPSSGPVPTTNPSGQKETEVASKQIGPQGGTVSGGGATIDIPEGALPSDTTIVIKTVDASSVTLPATAALAGAVYAFEPDDVHFLKPVTITVSVDPAKRSATGAGALVLLRSPTGANQWAVRGATLATADTVTAKTDHFSNWAAGAQAEAACFLNAGCTAGAGVGGLVGGECRVSASGAGVQCSGAQPPYTCTCDGQTNVIASFDEAPSASVLSALAVACGASCEDAGAPSGECAPSVMCGGSSAGDWACTTGNTTDPLHCEYTSGDTATCTCGASAADAGPPSPGPAFTIPATGTPPSSDEFVQLWEDYCAGVCQMPPDAGPDDACAKDGGSADAGSGGGGGPFDAGPAPDAAPK